MVSLYSPQNKSLWERSHKTLYSCSYLGQENLKVVDIKTIQSVVAIIPHSLVQILDSAIQREVNGKVFVVEKLGLDVMALAGIIGQQANTADNETQGHYMMENDDDDDDDFSDEP